MVVSVMKNVLKLRGVSTKSSRLLRRLVATRVETLSSVDKLQKYMYTVEAHMNIVLWKWEIVECEARTNWVGLTRHHVLVSGLNYCVPSIISI